MQEFHIVVTQLGDVGAGFDDHVRHHVQPDDASLAADGGPDDKDIVAGATAQIDDRLSLFQSGVFGGNPAAQAQVRLRKIPLQPLVVLGEVRPSEVVAAGVRSATRTALTRDLAVGVLDDVLEFLGFFHVNLLPDGKTPSRRTSPRIPVGPAPPPQYPGNSIPGAPRSFPGSDPPSSVPSDAATPWPAPGASGRRCRRRCNPPSSRIFRMRNRPGCARAFASWARDSSAGSNPVAAFFCHRPLLDRLL